MNLAYKIISFMLCTEHEHISNFVTTLKDLEKVKNEKINSYSKNSLFAQSCLLDDSQNANEWYFN